MNFFGVADPSSTNAAGQMARAHRVHDGVALQQHATTSSDDDGDEGTPGAAGTTRPITLPAPGQAPPLAPVIIRQSPTPRTVAPGGATFSDTFSPTVVASSPGSAVGRSGPGFPNAGSVGGSAAQHQPSSGMRQTPPVMATGVGAGSLAVFRGTPLAIASPAVQPARPPAPPPEPPRTVLVLGAPSTGKSSVINAFRQVTSPSSRWERAPVGRIGRSSAATVSYFTNTTDGEQRPATWRFVDVPGRVFHDLSTDDTRDARYLAALLKGVPAGVPVAGRSAWPLEAIEAAATAATGDEPSPGLSSSTPSSRVASLPEAIVVVVRGIDIAQQTTAWFGLQSVLQDAVSATNTVNYLADVLDWLHHATQGCVPHVIVTHMDSFSNRVKAEQFIRDKLHDVVPVANQHYVALPPSVGDNALREADAQRAERRAGSVEVPVLAQRPMPTSLAPRGAASGRPSSSPTTAGPSSPSSAVDVDPKRRLMERIGDRATPRHGLLALDDPSRAAIVELHHALAGDIGARRRRHSSATGGNAAPLLLAAPAPPPLTVLPPDERIDE